MNEEEGPSSIHCKISKRHNLKRANCKPADHSQTNTMHGCEVHGNAGGKLSVAGSSAVTWEKMNFPA